MPDFEIDLNKAATAVKDPPVEAKEPKGVVAKLRLIEDELKGFFIERNEVIHGAILAHVAKEHILMLGPPGCAKSDIAESLSAAFNGSKLFYYLMTRFTTPEEIFGQLSVRALEQDRFNRVTVGRLPEASDVVLDEIFKSSSSILNSLLMAINERKFFNDGVMTKLPLHTVTGTSNELPESKELDALYDRFMLRYNVGYIRETSGLKRLLMAPDHKFKTTVDYSEITKAHEEAMQIPVPEESADMLTRIALNLREEGIFVSDRRIRNCQHVIKAEAFLSGKTKVDEESIEIIQHCMWNDPKEISKTRSVILGVANPLAQQALEKYEMALEIKNNVYAIKEDDKRKKATLEANGKIKKLHVDLKKIVEEMKAKGKPAARYEEMQNRITVMHSEMLMECLGIDQKTLA